MFGACSQKNSYVGGSNIRFTACSSGDKVAKILRIVRDAGRSTWTTSGAPSNESAILRTRALLTLMRTS